jgi:Tfp pilus assembly PilM family ATPase
MSASVPASSNIIGVCLSADVTQAVELSLQRIATPSIRAIAEWQDGLQETPETIAERIVAFVDTNAVEATSVAITLDTSTLFAHVLPVPAGQDEPLLRKHAQWDLSQFFPDTPATDFITDVHLLGQQPGNGARRMLSVSIRRSLARALDHALKNRALELHILDGDHFSAEHYLVSRHPGGKDGLVFLTGLKSDRMDISVLQDGILADYFVRAECTADGCASALKECRNEYGRPRRIFLYGPQATTDLTESIHVEDAAAMEIVNPFKGMDIIPGDPHAAHFLATPHRFVPAIGVALREE